MSTTTVETDTQPNFHDLRGNTRSVERIRDYRRVEVGRMLLARTPIRQIAAKLNVSTATVQLDIKVVERWWQDNAIKDRKKVKQREVKILDELERSWLPRAHYDAEAVDVILRIMTRRAKLLGLDEPLQAQLEVTGGLDAARERVLQLVDDDLARRRELRERATQNGDAIDVESTG